MSDTINCPKCEYEHDADGCHEDLVGERTCDECGFAFIVEIEYDPSYSTKCVKHEAGDVSDEEALLGYGGTTRCKFCFEVMSDDNSQ